MTCRDFEARLAALAPPSGADRADPPLHPDERSVLLRHAEGCASCAELLELAVLARSSEPADGEIDLVAGVMAATSGPACEAALLRAAGDGGGRRDDALALHLAGCRECRALAGALEALAVDLPELAELDPGPAFAPDVLAASLPAPVRLRRWWARRGAGRLQGVWARWMRRPRFAWEAAFVATLALLPFGVASGPTLAAAPARAVEMAQEVPRLELARLEAEIEGTLREIGRGETARRTGRGFDALRATIGEVGEGVERGATAVATAVRQIDGTLRAAAASFLQDGDGDGPAARSTETPPEPARPASEETTR